MQRILICGVNWIGDTIMSMPAIQALRNAHPDAHLTLLVKPKMRALWEMHQAPDDILELQPGFSGTADTARMLRATQFNKAYIFPHSFRAAVIPFLAMINKRIGLHGHARDWMLTKVRPLGRDFEFRHQAYEYYHLMELPLPDKLPTPQLLLSEELKSWANQLLTKQKRPVITLIPGAARGPSKQWPKTHFIQLGQRLSAHSASSLLIMGAPNEVDLCSEIAKAIGPTALNMAGKTTLQEWAALMHQSNLVIANDSGGMHIASAVGTPVIAIYGITDPAKTGPIGAHCQVMQKSDLHHRDVPRESALAQEALAAITSEEIDKQARDLLQMS